MSVASEIARLQNAKASIKAAIENKGVTVGDIKLDAYSAKIDEISAGVEPTGTLEITENGTYDVKQKAYAKVAVPEPSGNIKITENGFHIIKQYSIAEVAVYPTLIAKTISANGTYNASDDNAYGYGRVSVNVPEKKLGTKNISANGDYNATDDSLDGYSNVSVSVPEKTLTTKTITANGTYNASDDNADGYSQVTVETSGVDINEYFWENFSLSGSQYNNSSNLLSILKKVIISNTAASVGNTFARTNLETIVFKPTVAKQLTIANSMFYNSQKLKTIQGLDYFDFSKVQDLSGMFGECRLLESVPYFDTSSCTTLSNAFYHTDTLSSVPLYNTSNVVEMTATFENSGVTSLPLFDTSNVTNMNAIVQLASRLKVFPALNTSKVTTMSAAFYHADALEEVKHLDFSKVTNIDYLFGYCSNLITLGGFENLGESYLLSSSANLNAYALKLSDCSKLTHDSLMNVINGLYDIANKGVMPQQLILGSTNLAKLTAEEIQIATDKGWEVS